MGREMNPRDYLQCAAELVKKGAAADCRTSVSRAYYAVFHVARDYLLQGGFRVAKSDSAHIMVARFLSWSNDMAIGDVSAQISDLRSARNEADYDLDRLRLENVKNASMWIETARSCIDVLDAAFTGSNREVIFQAIRVNEKKVTG
jgi:uncharacterized protein (UPF0332 family)